MIETRARPGAIPVGQVQARRQGALALVLGAALLAAIAGSARAQQTVPVTFAVADNTTFVETLRIDKTVVQGKAPPRRTLFEAKSHYTIRKTRDGYSLYVKPVKPLDMTVSEDTAALIAGIMTNLRLRYDLSHQGDLTDIVGTEQALLEVENLLPAQLRPVLGIMGITPALMKQQAAFDWNARSLFFLARYSGRSLPLGQEREVDAVYPSALGGVFKARGSMRASGPVACGKRRCILWQGVGVSRDPALGQALAQYLGATVKGLAERYAPAEAAKVPRFVISEPYEKVVLTRLMDPGVGLHHGYTQEHEVSGTFALERDTGAPLPFRITVKREYTYSYD
jgi:hypothetical protein